VPQRQVAVRFAALAPVTRGFSRYVVQGGSAGPPRAAVSPARQRSTGLV